MELRLRAGGPVSQASTTRWSCRGCLPAAATPLPSRTEVTTGDIFRVARPGLGAIGHRGRPPHVQCRRACASRSRHRALCSKPLLLAALLPARAQGGAVGGRDQSPRPRGASCFCWWRLARAGRPGGIARAGRAPLPPPGGSSRDGWAMNSLPANRPPPAARRPPPTALSLAHRPAPPAPGPPPPRARPAPCRRCRPAAHPACTRSAGLWNSRPASRDQNGASGRRWPGRP